MGRGNDDLVNSGAIGQLNKKTKSQKIHAFGPPAGQPQSLDVGRDKNGQEIRLGEIDSDGQTVGFIAPDGSCWVSVSDHDQQQTIAAFEKEMIAWQKGQSVSRKPNALEIAEEVCLDPITVMTAASRAEKHWEQINSPA